MSYIQYLPLRVGAWLRREFGGVWLEASGILGDVLADLAREAVKVKFVSRAMGAPDALNATGADRSLPRWPGESNVSYAARLAQAMESMEANGRPGGLTGELAGLGWANVTLKEAHDFDPGSPRWARFWIFIENSPTPHGATKAPPVGMGWQIGDGTLVGVGGLTADRIRRLRQAVVVWRPGHMHCEGVIFVLGTTLPVGLGWTIGDGTIVGGDSVRISAKG